MNLYDENLRVLLERFPELTDHEHDVREDITVSSQPVADQEVLFAQTDDGLMQLGSLYDFDPILDLWRNKMPDLKIYAKVLLFGIGNGSMVRKLLQSI